MSNEATVSYNECIEAVQIIKQELGEVKDDLGLQIWAIKASLQNAFQEYDDKADNHRKKIQELEKKRAELQDQPNANHKNLNEVQGELQEWYDEMQSLGRKQETVTFKRGKLAYEDLKEAGVASVNVLSALEFAIEGLPWDDVESKSGSNENSN